jgi:hypothetical protein
MTVSPSPAAPLTIPPVDVAALVHRNRIVYHCLTPDPAQSLYFSNGFVGGSLHTPEDSLYLLLSRSDMWNEKAGMGALAAVRLRGRPGLFTAAARVEQVCDLHRAAIVVRLWPGQDQPPVQVEVTCPRTAEGQDLLLVQIDDPGEQAGPWRVSLENWHPGDETGATGAPPLLFTTHVNRSSVFDHFNARVKVNAAALGIADPLLGRAWGLFIQADHAQATQAATETATMALSPAPRHRIVLAAIGRDPGQSLDSALTQVKQASQSALTRGMQHWDRLLQDHRRYWSEFWDRSYLALDSGSGDAQYEERLWYVNLYFIAAASGGRYPARFNGAGYLLDRDSRDWDFGYWFQNMRELCWPMIASGHPELMASFLQMYADVQRFAEAQTRSIFGIDGPAFRETQLFWGVSPDTDLVKQELHGGIHHNFSSSFEVCLLLEWYARATGDEQYLRQRVYPMVKAVLAMAMRWAKLESDGRCHWQPANALETWRDARDPMPDVAGMHYLLPRLIDWGQRFGEASATVQQWREFHRRLPAIPIGRWTIESRFDQGVHADDWHIASTADDKGLFLAAADKLSERVQRTNMENPELYVVFPWGLVGLDSDAATRRRFEQTWLHRTWKHINNGWAQDVPQLARMGWSEMAASRSLEHASFSQRFPNGAFISPAAPHFHGLLTNTCYLDAAGVHLTGIHEMLLQSHDGVIRILPAASGQWSGRFRLHTHDGFEVEAVFRQGRALAASIRSTHGRDFRLRNLGERGCRLSGAVEATARAGDLVEASVDPGATIHLTWDGTQPHELEQGLSERPEVIWPAYKLRPPAPCWPTGHWHDERNGHGQVGLDATGLFPATRKHATSNQPKETRP